MGLTGIILAAVIVGGTGLFIGVFLGISGKKFAVEVDEREEAILDVLPGITAADADMRDAPDWLLRSWQEKRKLADVPLAERLSLRRSARSWVLTLPHRSGWSLL